MAFPKRKYRLFQRRYQTCIRYRLLKPHARVVMKLGVDGMSSDEEVEGASFTQYRMTLKPWRSKAVISFLRVLDAVHRRYRQKAGSGTKRGSPPRLRYLGSEVSETKPVKRLPINAYDPTWYDNLKGLTKDELAAGKEPYNFDIDQSILDAVSKFRELVINGLTYV